MIFRDILYGPIQVPEWLIPFISLPEFLRLRGVRLSNIDSVEFKDFNGPTRWEHCIAVAHLALQYSAKAQLSQRDTLHLTLAALLHDVATPPFAHTVEYVLPALNHEVESSRILGVTPTTHLREAVAIYAAQLPQFEKVVRSVSRKYRFNIDIDEIAGLVLGEGALGYVINGTVDLDNLDNVTRASLYMGIEVERKVPLALLDWLTKCTKAPTDLDQIDFEPLRKWLTYRKQMYSAFYHSSDLELGRQAFLQHLIRRASNQGMSKSSIMWKTDEQLLHSIENSNESSSPFNTDIRTLVQRYRLLEAPELMVSIPLEDGALRILENPLAANWIEQRLSTKDLEVFALVRRLKFADQSTLFSEAGCLQLFRLSKSPIKYGHLPGWLRDAIPSKKHSDAIRHEIIKPLQAALQSWSKDQPWSFDNEEHRQDVIGNLNDLGNWSFRLSRNRSIHAYPATFVHAIPANLIHALGLQGGTVWDPFGGTGNTAVEAIKLGCRAVTSDSNTIATLIASARLTYLSPAVRKKLEKVNSSSLHRSALGGDIDFDRVNEWHHPDTIKELRRIRHFVEQHQGSVEYDFLRVCFSDILTSCTARRGKEHGYFADNTPLGKVNTKVPYQPACDFFLERMGRNIGSIEQLYASLERLGRPPEEACARATVLNSDARSLDATMLPEGTEAVDAIICSPPYVGMADYSLGLRLSYSWLFPERLAADFGTEIGARRRRFDKDKALVDYYESMRLFVQSASNLIRRNGYLAMVIGAPVSTAFKDKGVLKGIDDIFSDAGFDMIWNTLRPINWHRNHGYARLNHERVSVHVFNGDNKGRLQSATLEMVQKRTRGKSELTNRVRAVVDA